MRKQGRVRVLANVLLALGTLVILSSVLLVIAGVLVPLHWLAVRRTRSWWLRGLWIVLASFSAMGSAWAIAYQVGGEAQPWIWLLPLFASIAVGVTFALTAARNDLRSAAQAQ